MVNELTTFWTKLRRLIGASKKILIATHLDPDGDAVCSALALAHVFRRWRRKAGLYCVNDIPDRYSFLKGVDGFRTDYDRYDLLVIVDTAKIRRVAHDFVPLHDRIVNIDHHKSNDRFGMLKIIDAKASSSCELLYNLLSASRFPIDRVLAEILYAGLFAETGGFTFANTTPDAVRTGYELIRRGANPWNVAKRITERTAAAFRLLGMVLGQLRVENGIAVSSVTRKMLEQSGASITDTENFVSLMLSVQGAQVAIFFREGSDDKLKVSLRSSGKVDVDRIAAQFGGGGHRTAAGLRTSKARTEIEAKLVQAIRRAMV